MLVNVLVPSLVWIPVDDSRWMSTRRPPLDPRVGTAPMRYLGRRSTWLRPSALLLFVVAGPAQFRTMQRYYVKAVFPS
jgi:hypothetical protein